MQNNYRRSRNFERNTRRMEYTAHLRIPVTSKRRSDQPDQSCHRVAKRVISVNATHQTTRAVTDDEAEDDSGESHIDPLPPQVSDDDQGFLDLVEEGAQGFDEGAAVLRRLDKHIRELGEKMARGAKDLTDEQNETGDINPSRVKKIINSVADDIARIAPSIQAEIVPFKNTFTTGIRAYGRAAKLLPDFGGHMTEQLKDAISNTLTLEREISKAKKRFIP